jgi:hypothetical protein
MFRILRVNIFKSWMGCWRGKMGFCYISYYNRTCKKQCFGSALVSMRIWIRIQLFTSMQIQIRIRIRGAKPIRVQVRLCSHKKLDFDLKYTSVGENLFWKAWNQVYLLILVNFLPPGSGSRRAIAMRILNRNTGKEAKGRKAVTYNHLGKAVSETTNRWIESVNRERESVATATLLFFGIHYRISLSTITFEFRTISVSVSPLIFLQR